MMYFQHAQWEASHDACLSFNMELVIIPLDELTATASERVCFDTL